MGFVADIVAAAVPVLFVLLAVAVGAVLIDTVPRAISAYREIKAELEELDDN